MSLIQTKSYRLAVYEKGDVNAAKLAVVLPGRLETKDYAHIRSHVDALSESGFYTIAFDPPGTWESPGTIEDYTVTNYLHAVNEVIEHFGNKPTLLVGHSLGGSIAALAGASNDNVIAYVGLMSLASGPRTTQDLEWKTNGKITFLRDLPPGDHHTHTKKQYDLPYSFFEDSLMHDTRSALHDSNKPKLFLIGKQDTQNGTSSTPEIYFSIAEPKQLVEVDAPHGYRYSEAIISQINIFITNFAKQLESSENRTT